MTSNTQPRGAKGSKRLRESGDTVKRWLSARRPWEDCPERWTSYRTEACVAHNEARAQCADESVVAALNAEHQAAVDALARLRPETLTSLGYAACIVDGTCKLDDPPHQLGGSGFHMASGNGWSMYWGDYLQVMREFDGQVDHVITDPPYEVEAHTKARRSLKDATQKKGARNKGEVRRIDEALEIDFGAITDDMRSACGEFWAQLARRWAIAFCQVEAVASWRSSLVAGGLDWVRGGVWIKPNGAPQFTGDRPGQGFECLAIAHAKGRKQWNGGGKHGVWTVPLDHRAGGGGKNEHPTTKPLALMLQLIDDFTDEGEVILDPFCGSGTTGAACLRRGRRFVGVERERKYFDLAVERLRAEEACSSVEASRAGQLSLLGDTG